MVVGLIADTHGLLRPEALAALSGVDLIVHAGDVGSATVLEGLGRLARVEAVSGNLDDRDDPALTRHRAFPVGALTLHVSHGDELGRPTPAILLARYAGGILVYGHTHRSLVHRSDDGRLVINPGSAGPRRFGGAATVARLTVVGLTATVEFITL